MTTKAAPGSLRAPRKLKWVNQATKNDDELAALDDDNPLAIVVDWKETPVLLYGLAHLIAQHVRPAEFPPIDTILSYGMLRGETAAMIRDFIDGVSLLRACHTTYAQAEIILDLLLGYRAAEQMKRERDILTLQAALRLIAADAAKTALASLPSNVEVVWPHITP